MKLIDLVCPNCNAIMQVDGSQLRCKCEYCGNEMIIDMPSSQEIKITGGFEFGYEAEMGKAQARRKIEEEAMDVSPAMRLFCNALAEKEKEITDIWNKERENTRKSFFKLFDGPTSEELAIRIHDGRASVINNYPLPNNPKMILEFIVMADSFLDPCAFLSQSSDQFTDEMLYATEEVQAWHSKFKAAYRFATINFSNSKEYEVIEKIYITKMKQINAARGKWHWEEE